MSKHDSKDVKPKSKKGVFVPRVRKHPNDALTRLTQMKRMMSLVSSLSRESKDLQKSADSFDVKYVAIDAKAGAAKNPYSDALLLKAFELKQMRATARSMWGGQTFKIQLNETLTQNSNASGDCFGVTVVDPGLNSEFAACAALFDEFRVVSGVLHFVCCSYKLAASNVVAFGCVAFDPSDNTALVTGPQVGCQLAQHMLFPIAMLIVSTTNPFVNDQKHVFEYRIPKGILLQATPTASDAVGSGWQPTVGTPMNYGWIKTVATSCLPVSSCVFSSVHQMHTEFRIRE